MSEPVASLAASLMNDGVAGFRTSVRGEPRGPLCGMGICFECRVEVNGTPHHRACMIPVRDELGVRDERAMIEADVAVVGAGPAGLAAAAHAAAAGKRVVLLDAAAEAGGQIWRHAAGSPAPRAALEWLARTRLVRRLSAAEVIDAPSARELLVSRGDAVVRVRAAATVLATGARELFLPFSGWTLPNVLGVGGLQALVKNGLDVRGKRIVIAGSGPLLFPVAAHLAASGARITLVAEQAPSASVRGFVASLWSSPERLAAAAWMRARFWRTRYRVGTWVVRADGDGRVRQVTLTDGVRTWREDCDYLACAFGLLPNVELARVLGARIEHGAIAVNAKQSTAIDGLFAAGECTGVGGAPLAIAEGAIAGLAAAAADIPRALVVRRTRERAFAERLARAFAPRAELRALAGADVILCRCEDVTCGDVARAHSAREAKLVTRAGMGACQGRVCGGAMEFLHGWAPAEPRAPIFPVPVRALTMHDAEAP